MKSNPAALLGLTVLAGFLAVAPVRAGAEADVIADDEFEALLDELHGGAAPTSRVAALDCASMRRNSPSHCRYNELPWRMARKVRRTPSCSTLERRAEPRGEAQSIAHVARDLAKLHDVRSVVG